MENTMRHVALGGLAICALALAALAAQAAEEKVDLKDVPKAVLDAVKAKFPGAKLKEASKEKDKGKTVYELSIQHEGHKIDVSLTSDGKIVSIEKQIAFKALPKPVADAFKKKYAKAKVSAVEEVTAGKKITYEIHFTVGKKKMEIVYDPEGKVVNVEEEKGEKKEGKKE
jgi:uncharacterized membrane protein YkoI